MPSAQPGHGETPRAAVKRFKPMPADIRLWFVAETAKAVRYSRVPLSGNRHPDDADMIWIPKSVVEHRSKRGLEHVVTLPDWFVDKEAL